MTRPLPVRRSGAPLRRLALAATPGRAVGLALALLAAVTLVISSPQGLVRSAAQFQDSAAVAGNSLSAATLAAPTSLSATRSGSTVALSWSASSSSSVTGYVVQRASSTSGPWTQIATTSGRGATSYSDTSAPANQTSYYRVAAQAYNWVSGVTNTGQVTGTVVVTALNRSHDMWVDAGTLPSIGSGQSMSISVDNNNASGESFNAGCLNRSDVWGKFTPTSSGRLAVSTSISGDPTLAILSTSQQCLTYNDDSGSLQSSLSLSVSAGVTYYIGVGRCCGTSNYLVPDQGGSGTIYISMS